MTIVAHYQHRELPDYIVEGRDEYITADMMIDPSHADCKRYRTDPVFRAQHDRQSEVARLWAYAGLPPMRQHIVQDAEQARTMYVTHGRGNPHSVVAIQLRDTEVVA